jgi:hypothetical protein
VTSTQLFDRWKRDSQFYKKFRTETVTLLDSDEIFRAAKTEWEEYFTTSHGDVFDDIELENPRRELFVDLLYYDFIVDQIIELSEREFGFTITNQEPRTNTDALSFSYQQLHRQIIDTEAVAHTFADYFDKGDLRSAGTEFLRALYESVVSRKIRLQLGEYYTPRGVAELAFNELSPEQIVSDSFLDPGCGSGVFNAVCITRKIRQMQDDHTPDEILSNVTSTVYGIDLNPVAVKSTKLAYLLSLLPILEQTAAESVEVPVFLTDALKLTREDDITFQNAPLDLTVDHLVGNPPWITWGRLSDSVKEQWQTRYVDKLDLFPHEGADSRLGHGNDDISIPYIWVCMHHYLSTGGTASFVLKRDIMKGPAGKLLRTLNVAGRPLDMTHVHDFNKLQPFGDQVGANTAIYTLRADRKGEFPIPTTSWTSSDTTPNFDSFSNLRNTLDAKSTKIIPLEEDNATSAWIRTDAERGALGDCDHDIRHGVKDDAQAVYSIDRTQLSSLESRLIYPYIKSKHVVKYGLFGHELHLVPINKANEDNEDKLQNQYPQTYEYLSGHRKRLEDRSSAWLKEGPFYNIFGLGEYTWADYKVVWCRLGFKPDFTVISETDDPDLGTKMVVPGDHYMFIPTDSKYEAHFLCALLNSALYQRSLKDIATEGKASLSKTAISQLELPEWTETERTKQVAELSMEAHDIVSTHLDKHRDPDDGTISLSKRAYNKTTIDELEVVQAEIDRLVEELLADGTLFPDASQSTPSPF